MKATIIITLSFIAITGLASETSVLGYDHWISEEFEGETLEAELLAMDADPDHDGISNLVEYALDSDPHYSSMEALPKVDVTSGKLTFTYTRDNAKTDIHYQVQMSHDLRQWQTVTTETLTAKGSIDRQRATLPVTQEPTFLRLIIRLASLD